MKKLLLFTFIAFISFPVFSQEEVDAESEIKSVTVFLKGAEITRKAKPNVKRGTNIVVLKGLETGINPKSIQVAAPKDVVILSVEHRINTLANQEEPAKITRVRDSLELVSLQLERLADDKAVLEQEKTMVLNNQKLSGKEEAVSTEELEKATNFFRKRLGEIHDRLFKIKQESKKLKEQKKKLSRQLRVWNAKRNQPTNEVVIGLDAPVASSIFLKVNYYVSNAGWVPRYDLRASGNDSLVTVDYRADILQQTGIDWKKAKLTLSTSNPVLGGKQPTLGQWNLYAYDYSKGKNRGLTGYKYARPAPKSEGVTEETEALDDAWGADSDADGAFDNMDVENTATLADFTQVTESQTATEFIISLPQDIPSDGQYHQTMIQQHELPALFEHFAIPKLDKDAFLLARMTGWEDLKLLPGKASIYLDGTFVGDSYVDPYTTDDTLDFSLGRDKNVIIKRTQLKDFNSTKLIGLNRVKTYGYEYEIRNTKKQAIHLKIQDNLPVSQDKSIEVELLEGSGAKHNENTGKMEWELDIAPQETKKLKFVFKVKYPKNKSVNGL